MTDDPSAPHHECADNAYRRGRTDGADAILEWAMQHGKTFMWVEKAIQLARGDEPTSRSREPRK